MRNEKIQEQLRMIEKALTHGNVPVALAHLHSLSTALESEEVVAEGWAFLGERPGLGWEVAFLQGRSPSARYVRILAVKEE